MPLGTKDARQAAPLLAIANGEYEKKVALFRKTLEDQTGGSLSPDEAKALVERYLTGRAGSGFATGGTQATFILLELNRAVDDLVGKRIPSAQSMKDWECNAYRQKVAGSDDDDEFSEEALARIEADHAERHRPPGSAWFECHDRVPRRRWRPLLSGPVEALKRQLALAPGSIPGIDEPLADALANALRSPEILNQLPQAPSARRRDAKGRARPDMKLSAMLAFWKDKRKPSPKAIVAAE